METAFWEELDTDNFNVFIRDLSSSVNTNLKHMIEDSGKEYSNKNKKDTKSKKMKKKDIIILEQNKKRYNRSVEEDKRTIDFLLKNINDDNPYLNFEKIKTDEGKREYKFNLLERYWKKKYVKHIFILYFHLKEENDLSRERNELFEKIKKVLNKYDSKLFMFSDLGDLLPPLNFWNKGPLKLDGWQQDVIKMIQNKQSVIVRAPTSSGKTFIAMAAGILHNNILYVCPAKPVAYQVGANFIKMGYRVHFLIEGHAHRTYNEKNNIFIGIPETVEKYIYKTGTHFNYAIFDEIHNLNDSYENIIKLLNCNFLALSATINNKEYLREKLGEYYPNYKINYVEYNTRFINQQRWIFNDKLSKLHPLCCLDVNNFNLFKNISFTPNDCSVLYEKLSETFEDTDLEDYIDDLSPDNYFKEDKLLTLDDTRTYEKLLKENIEAIYKKYPEKLNNILSGFNKELKDKNNDSFISLFQDCKKKELLPMILFHTDESISKEIFNIIDKELRETEEDEYPFHYDILEKKKEYYEKYVDTRKDYSSKIKIKTKDAFTEKREKMLEYDKRERNRYIENISHYYGQCIGKCKKEKQINNLNKELNEFLQYPDFRMIDPFVKHKKFCFTPQEPMSGSEIKSIKREIKKTTGKTIEYEDPLFQLLKRGIGIYIESNPQVYNWIVQRLMTEKKLGIVISDKTLCMGIDLPIRSVCFSGYKDPEFTKEDYLQMSGRAGRRGKDTQGNIIFHNINNYRELMMGELPELKFQDKEINPTYRSLKGLNKKIDLSRLNIKDTQEIENPKLYKLLWYLKNYKRSLVFVQNIKKYEKKLFLTNEIDREYTLFNHINENLIGREEDLLTDYKFNRKNKKIYEIGSVCRDIINSLHPMEYKIIIESSKKIFNKIKNL